MADALRSLSPAVNNTVKLPVALRRRIRKAMAADGFTVWSEFCRVALMGKCHEIENRVRARDRVASPGRDQIAPVARLEKKAPRAIVG